MKARNFLAAGRTLRREAGMIELNDVDGPLQDIKYMAEIAAELSDNLDGNGAQAGFFQISVGEGNRLGFCCNDLLRRVDELLKSLSSTPK